MICSNDKLSLCKEQANLGSKTHAAKHGFKECLENMLFKDDPCGRREWKVPKWQDHRRHASYGSVTRTIDDRKQRGSIPLTTKLPAIHGMHADWTEAMSICNHIQPIKKWLYARDISPLAAALKQLNYINWCHLKIWAMTCFSALPLSPSIREEVVLTNTKLPSLLPPPTLGIEIFECLYS